MPIEETRGVEVLRASGLTKVFGGDGVEVHALRGVDLGINKAQCVAIMGPSGSGKSTLLNVLGGLEMPTSGQVWIEGTDVTTLNDNERTIMRRRRLGFIFQSFNLIPTLNVLENVTLPLRLDGLSAQEVEQNAVRILETVKMAHRLKHLPAQLSGGEQQRVAIARALVIRPAMLLADEPTGNLDTSNSRQVTALFRILVDEQQQTVVLATHDPRVAGHADRLIQILDGRIRYDGPPTEEMLWIHEPEEDDGR
jgi:putative ABC transport system ATP-binding protein